jgi:hypothetical protein
VAVELVGGSGGGQVDFVGVCEGLAGQGVVAEDTPPRLLQVEPAGAFGDEDLFDSGVIEQPGPGGNAVVAGQVVRDGSVALSVALVRQA